MPIQPAPSITIGLTTGAASQVLGQPELLWAASWWGDVPPTTDRTAFPDQSDRPPRKNMAYNVTSVSFRAAVRKSTRLWILDGNFDVPFGFVPLYETLRGSNVRELKINTGMASHVMAIEAKKQEIIELLSKSGGATSVPVVEVRYTATTGSQNRGEIEPHDRFAIVDYELWHFGHTVGGSQRSVNAFSRGWPANDTGAITYFEELWGYR